MPDYVRVKDKSTKHEYSVVASAFDADVHELLEAKEAAHCDGTPLPPKHHLSLSKPNTTTGRAAGTEKE